MGNKHYLVFDLCMYKSYFKCFCLFLMTEYNQQLLTVWKRILLLLLALGFSRESTFVRQRLIQGLLLFNSIARAIILCACDFSHLCF